MTRQARDFETTTGI